MNHEREECPSVIDLGTASTETRGGPIELRVDEQGYFSPTGISDD